ncbi:hypothetical protein CMQ_2810 [Grosmannia clavigera kw1407]|uniref:Uncharacterized protein n=1 Tax=Grosmannia clavigera (strain kw1407 / UAMH 11150) TaxID=655863 RepID=F0XHS1_GROCL|nr:uncharacterized protein CMQ_2810 [Grosmannia clavigera kw1407]EFX02881.1 hypothetical protein CMQ_2810 [Grosmannia clavigera kw1407]
MVAITSMVMLAANNTEPATFMTDSLDTPGSDDGHARVVVLSIISAFICLAMILIVCIYGRRAFGIGIPSRDQVQSVFRSRCRRERRRPQIRHHRSFGHQ